MRQIDRYPDPRALQTRPVGRVYWRGAWIVADEVEVTRELGSGLPDQVVGASGLTGGEATVTLHTNQLVTHGFHLPWRNAAMPRQGEDILIELGLEDEGVAAYGRVLTGRVDSCAGEITDPTVQVRCVDLRDRLDRGIALEALHRVMPPAAPETDATLRNMGIHPAWLTARLAEACGFHATPPVRAGETCFSAPLIGSTWPSRGTLLRSAPRVGDAPGYASTPWGVGVTDINATWRPNRVGVRTMRLARWCFVQFLATAPTGEGVHHIILDWSLDSRIHIRVGGSSVTVGAGADATVAPQVTCTFPSSVYDTGAAHVSVWVGDDGSTTIRVGDAATTGHVDVRPVMVESELQAVRLVSESSNRAIGGLSVGFTSERSDLHAWTPTALIDSPYWNVWYSFPGIFGDRAIDVLDAQSQAEMSAIWLDEYGRLQYRTRDRLSAAPVVGTLTMDDLLELPWAEQWSSLRSQARVKYRSVTSRISTRPIHLVWQGSSTVLESGDVHEDVAEPNADVSWLGVDTNLKNPYYEAARFNRRDGSFIAGTVEDTEDDVAFLAGNSHMNFSLARLDGRSFAVTVSATNLRADQQLSLNTGDDAKIYRRFHNMGTPIVRACGVFKLHEVEITATAVAASPSAPEYVHDAGWYVQSHGQAQSIANRLATYTAQPLPTLDWVDVLPDDRRELGDVYRLELVGRMNSQGHVLERMNMRALCVGIKDTLTTNDDGAPSRTQQLRLQILETGV